LSRIAFVWFIGLACVIILLVQAGLAVA